MSKSKEIKYLEYSIKDTDNVGVFDTHAHIYDEKFTDAGITPEILLKRAGKVGVRDILIPADNVITSQKAMEYVKKYDKLSNVNLYCSVGVHPHEAEGYDETGADAFINNALQGDFRKVHKICAIGEIGLDYYYDFSPRGIQKEVFTKQLQLAYEFDIPVIIHERDATGDSINILNKFYKDGNLRKNPGVIHCCSCSAEIAAILLKMGFYLGFDGPITFKNNKKNIEVLTITPIDKIVVETDSPYLTPEPNRGRINEPAHVNYVLNKVADVKGIDVENLLPLIYDNSRRLFEIKE